MTDVEKQRENMVKRQLKGRDITNEKVLDAMREIPREKFVNDKMRSRAYQDSALPIGSDQTISQPYVVAKTIQTLEPEEDDIILDVGTGSGYAAAVAAKIVKTVYSVERVESLYRFAQRNLEAAGIENVELRYGDGSKGWPEHAPYDGIMVSAAASEVPDPLKDQLATNSHLVIPVKGGIFGQKLRKYTKKEDDSFEQNNLSSVRFVPLVRGKE